jgi:circadian clock protein KaiC
VRGPDTPPSAASGVEGLDDILRGGYPTGRVILIEGDPGAGKTTVALQFLIEGQKRGERGLYVSLSETREELNAVATSHGWSLEGIEIFELTPPQAFDDDEQNTLFHPSEVELAEMTRAVVNVCAKLNPQRLVFDSLSEIRLLAQSPLRYRREVLAIKQHLGGRNCTVLLLDDRSGPAHDGQLQSIAHGVVTLEQLVPEYGAHRRRLRITKLRGVQFRGGYHDFVIQKGGVQVFPRLVAAEHGRPLSEGVASSGVPELDAMLGGGLDRGTSALFVGPPGTGKSALASQWLAAGAKRGETGALYAFDESIATLEKRSRALGIDLAAARASKRIVLRQVDPAEISPGQLSHEIRHLVEDDGVRLIVIDSLNGYLNAMPNESFLLIHLHELLSYLGQKGVMTILVVAQKGLVGPNMASPLEVSYLADTVLLFRHFESRGAVHQAVSVLKKRTGVHEKTIRELSLSAGGISAGKPLDKFRGVLTGVPELFGIGGRSSGNGSDP